MGACESGIYACGAPQKLSHKVFVLMGFRPLTRALSTCFVCSCVFASVCACVSAELLRMLCVSRCERTPNATCARAPSLFASSRSFARMRRWMGPCSLCSCSERGSSGGLNYGVHTHTHTHADKTPNPTHTRTARAHRGVHALFFWLNITNLIKGRIRTAFKLGRHIY